MICTSKKGFTLLELLITITIIVFVASLAAPALRGFGQNRALNNAGNTIQAIFLKARSVAISKKTEIRVVFFIDSTEKELVKQGNSESVSGRIGTMHMFFFDKLDGSAPFKIQEEPMELPENTKFQVPAVTTEYIFHPDGTIHFANDKDRDPEVDTDTDIVVEQTGSSAKSCYIDIVRNTGRIIFALH